jgi:hypothetical protein
MVTLLALVPMWWLVTAAAAIVALVIAWFAIRMRRARVTAPAGRLVLPHVEAPRPRRRLANGSVAPGSADSLPVGVASQRTLRPSHARRV